MTTRGRPREFDLDAALDSAVEVFWRQGYEGTTLTDLTSAMNINRPSLYAAFGNKEATFRQAVTRYAKVDMAYVNEALSLPTARGVAEHFLRSNLVAITLPGRPPGCLSVQGGLTGSDEDRGVVEFLAESRRTGEQHMADRFRRAIADGDLDASETADELAKFLHTVSAGMAVQAAAGVPRSKLAPVVERALRAFPAEHERASA